MGFGLGRRSSVLLALLFVPFVALGLTVGRMSAATSPTLAAVAQPPFALRNKNLPAGMVGFNYSHTFSVSGGTAPFTFALTGGTLPAGLMLNANTGTISGIPTQSGNFRDLEVTVTDSTGATAKSPKMSIFVNDAMFYVGAQRGAKNSREAGDLTRQTGRNEMNLTLVVTFTVNGGAVQTANVAVTVPANARSDAACMAMQTAVKAALMNNFDVSDCFSTATGDFFTVTPKAGVALVDPFPRWQGAVPVQYSRTNGQLSINIHRP